MGSYLSYSCDHLFKKNAIPYRIWQMGLAICSVSLLFNFTVNVQVEGAVTGVDGDCQYVLFIVTVPPQEVTTSVRQVY